ncbi:MAG: Gfo/Idh/MocA family oxidoreductase [Planctomycetes bacterium]|nr:Gfo/Idh/MocA family oxidoreductase [Planctomycetota bacterium]
MDQVTLGIIGYGGIAKNYHIPAIAQIPEAKMLAVADMDEGKAKDCAETYDIPDVYTDYRRIMDRDDIDAIILLTRCDTHVEIVSAAAETGKHVFMQKPFAMNSEDGQKIVDMAKEGNIRVVTSFMHRYMDETVKAGELIRDGAIGKVRMIRQRNCTFNSYETAVRLWGAVQDIGPHGIDLIRFFANEKFAKVATMMDPFVSGITPNTDGPDGRAVDMVSVMNYEMTGQVLVSHEVFWDQAGGQGRFMSEIYGSEGALFVRPMFTDKSVAVVKQGKPTEFPDLDETPFGVRHHQVFINDILNDTYESASPEEGFEVLRVIEANYESAVEGGAPVVV